MKHTVIRAITRDAEATVGGRDILTETQGLKKGSNRQGVGGTASQAEGIALGSSGRELVFSFTPSLT